MKQTPKQPGFFFFFKPFMFSMTCVEFLLLIWSLIEQMRKKKKGSSHVEGIWVKIWHFLLIIYLQC